eukprot:jgi/Tetstr1/425011/TSEL_015479.t1
MAKHPTKVHPEPTQQLQHLGLDLDLVQFLYLAMPPARFYLREAHTVLDRCSSPSGKVVLTRQRIRDLEWWRDVPTRHNGAPILRPVETAYLHTDSSQYGWAINAFFTDNFKEPPALGPFVNQAMRGWELAQQVLDTPDYRVSLPADVALACVRRAQRLVSHSITMYRRVLTGKPSGAPRPVLQIFREAHPEIAELLEFFVTCRDHVLPGATRFWQLPDDDPGTWTAATVSEWVIAPALAADATPPVGFCWSSHSLRSGGASAASATGVPMPTVRWLGGWKVGSGVVLN